MPTIHHLDGATLRPAGGPELVGADELVSHVLVVELGSRIVLVDTGIGLADVAAPIERLGTEFCELSGPVLDPERTVARQLLSLGLAYFHRAALVGGAVPPGIEMFEGMVEQDRKARLDTVARLRSLPAEVTVVCSHDPVEFASVREPQGVEGVDDVEVL